MAVKTPVKLYVRQEKCCRFCGDLVGSKHCLNIFNQAARTKGIYGLAVQLGIVCNDDPTELSNFCCQRCQTVLTNCNELLTKAKHVNESLKGYFITQKRLRHSPDVAITSNVPDTEAIRPRAKKLLYARREGTDVQDIQGPVKRQLFAQDASNEGNSQQQKGSLASVPQPLLAEDDEEQQCELPTNPTFDRVKKYRGVDGLHYSPASCLITDLQRRKLLMAVNSMSPAFIVEIVMSIPTLKLAAQKAILDDLRKDIDENIIPQRKTSVLRSTTYDSLVDFSWENVIAEMSERCPFFLDVLMTVMNKTGTPFPSKKLPVLATIYGMTMYQRYTHLNLLPRMMTILLIKGGAKKELYRQLDHCGVSQSHSQKSVLLELIGKNFIDGIARKVASGRTFSLCFDNLDWMVHSTSLSRERRNKDVHAITTSYVIDRIDLKKITGEHLDQPKKCLEEITPELFKLTDAERNRMREDYIILVSRILANEVKDLKFLGAVAQRPLITKYAKEMETRTEMRFFEVVFANELKYNEIIRCMDQMESWVYEIYESAGLLPDANPTEPTSSDEDSQLPSSGTSRPGQPGAHARPRPDQTDPLRGIAVPLSADQLSRVRAAGAKDLRAGCAKPRHRFDHLHPILCNLWHAKKSFLSLVYDVLMPKNSAVKDKGTMKHLKEKLGRHNADNPDKHYQECENFFSIVGKAYLLSAAKRFFGIEKFEDPLTDHAPQLEDMPPESIEEYMIDVVGRFVDEYVFTSESDERIADSEARARIQETSRDIRSEHCYSTVVSSQDVQSEHSYSASARTETFAPIDHNPDPVRNHSSALLRMYLFLTAFIDMEKTGNGDRLVAMLKTLLLYFKCGVVNRKNYAIEMFVAIAQIEALLTPREAEHAIYSRFVNLRGGARNGMATDLGHENGNGVLKDLIKGMGANKTEAAIQRVSRASSGLHDVSENFNKVTNLHRLSSRHSTPKTDAQLAKIVAVLDDNHVWDRRPGRTPYATFLNIERDTLNHLDERKFDQWLEDQISLIPVGNHW